MSFPRSVQRENERKENSAKLQNVAIEELFVVKDAEENGSDGLQQPGADRLALGVAHAVHAGDGVWIFDFALHVSSLFLTGPLWRNHNIAEKIENPSNKRIIFSNFERNEMYLRSP